VLPIPINSLAKYSSWNRKIYNGKKFNESKGNAQLKERREIYTAEDKFHNSDGNAVLVDEETGIVLQFKGELHTIEDSKTFSETELLENIRGAAINSDAAGSGKTTILTRFLSSFKTEETQYVGKRFDLGKLDVLENIDKFEVDEYMIDEYVQDFLEFVANVNNELTKNLFHQRLNGNGEIVIMMDGFDEICDKYHQEILKLLEKIIGCNKIHQLWISTRPHAVKILEKAVNVKTVCLLLFLSENQIEFVTNYWNRKMIKRGKTD
jgi:predicted NACHT family NTPase